MNVVDTAIMIKTLTKGIQDKAQFWTHYYTNEPTTLNGSMYVSVLPMKRMTLLQRIDASFHEKDGFGLPLALIGITYAALMLLTGAEFLSNGGVWQALTIMLCVTALYSSAFLSVALSSNRLKKIKIKNAVRP